MGKIFLNGQQISAESFCISFLDGELHIDFNPTEVMQPAKSCASLPLNFQTKDLFLTSLLSALQAPANLSGYPYLKRALDLGIDNPDIYTAITKTLYPVLSREFGDVGTSKIERSLHGVIVPMLDHCDPAVLKWFFGSASQTLSEKRNNAYVLSLMATRIQLLLAEHPLGT